MIDGARLVFVDPFGIGRRRAHVEMDRPVDDGERLALSILEPAAFTPVFAVAERDAHGLEPLVLVPLAEGPFGRAVNPGVGVVAVQVEQLLREVLASAAAKSGGPTITQGQDQGPPGRGVVVKQDGLHRRAAPRRVPGGHVGRDAVELAGEYPGIRLERA